MADQPDRNAQLHRKVKGIADEAGDLLGRLQFSGLTDALKRARGAVAELEGRLARVRGRGFVWRGSLEGQLAEAKQAAPAAAEQVLDESRGLDQRFQGRVDALLRRARGFAMQRELEDDAHAIDVLEEEHEDIDKAIRDAERRLSSITAPVTDAVRTVERGLKQVEDTLDRFEAATFSLQPGEHPVAFHAATWTDAPGGEKAGHLLFTDARLRFEQQEERVTKKKFLFFTAESETLHALLLDEPVGYLAASDDSTKGWVFKDQLLALRWDDQASCPDQTTFEIDGATAKDVDILVEGLRDGSILADRFEGAGVIEVPVFTFPEKCTACAGPLPAAVKGQRTLDCPFCGQVNNPLSPAS